MPTAGFEAAIPVFKLGQMYASDSTATGISIMLYRVILSVLDPRKREYLKDYSLDFEHAYMTTYLAS